MTEQTTDVTVQRTVTVEVSQARAFAVFTERIGEWWPLETHQIGEAPAQTAVLEPREGGRWFERGTDGSECNWGRVLTWEPPERVVLAWHLNSEWRFDPDPTVATEVEVRFIAEGPETTRVELEHRGFERLGEPGERMRAAVGSDGGWSGILERYAGVVRG